MIIRPIGELASFGPYSSCPVSAKADEMTATPSTSTQIMIKPVAFLLIC
jgi:hypothetical protein